MGPCEWKRGARGSERVVVTRKGVPVGLDSKWGAEVERGSGGCKRVLVARVNQKANRNLKKTHT